MIQFAPSVLLVDMPQILLRPAHNITKTDGRAEQVGGPFKSKEGNHTKTI